MPTVKTARTLSERKRIEIELDRQKLHPQDKLILARCLLDDIIADRHFVYASDSLKAEECITTAYRKLEWL